MSERKEMRGRDKEKKRRAYPLVTSSPSRVPKEADWVKWVSAEVQDTREGLSASLVVKKVVRTLTIDERAERESVIRAEELRKESSGDLLDCRSNTWLSRLITT